MRMNDYVNVIIGLWSSVNVIVLLYVVYDIFKTWKKEVVPAKERWLYNNPEALASVKRGLKQSGDK